MNNSGDTTSRSLISTILVVDDDENLRSLLTRSLAIKGYTVIEASDAESAFQIICEEKPDLVLSDIAMPGIDGIALMKKTKARFPDLDFIIMTGYAIEYSYVDIMDAGASDYMTKPFSINSAVARINRIEREKRTLQSLRKSNLELNRAMEKANQLAREAESASRAKTDFLARMSHEIRTPLNGIIGYADILFDTFLSGEQEDYVKYIKISCEALLTVVNDILDFSKVEAGELPLEAIDFDPEVLCFETLELIRPKINEASVALMCSIDDAVPGLVTGDPHRFRQVLLNLLGNAAKFTSSGHIELRLKVEEASDGNIILHNMISDTGIGIPKEQVHLVFEPFQQCEDTTTRRYEGTGLGLAISRKIVEAMGGRIWFEAGPDGGSVFHFTIRVVKSLQSIARKIRPVSLSGRKALVIMEDNPTRAMLIQDLVRAGMSVDRVSPHENLETPVDPDKVPDYDIGIVDVGRNGASAFSKTLSFFSEFHEKGTEFPMIACSVPDPGEAERCRKEGFQGFLPKPVQPRKLFSMISSLLGMSKEELQMADAMDAGIVTSHAVSEGLKRSASILLVEDNPVNRKMAEIMLTKAGYVVTTATNGREVLDRITQDSDTFDLIFMDVHMPEMDGLEATRRIRELERSIDGRRRIPIIALTANVLKEFEDQCFEAGMDDFLTKPIRRDLVFKAVHKWVFGEGSASSSDF